MQITKKSTTDDDGQTTPDMPNITSSSSTTNDRVDDNATTTNNNNNTNNNNSNDDDLHYYNPEIIKRYIQFYDNNASTTTEDPPTNKKQQKKKAKRKSKKHIPPKVLELRREIQFCCKDNDLVRALGVFRRALMLLPSPHQSQSQSLQRQQQQQQQGDGGENGGKDKECGGEQQQQQQQQRGGASPVELEPQSLYNLLNLCDGSFGSGDGRVVHVGTPKTTSSSSSQCCRLRDGDDEQLLGSTTTANTASAATNDSPPINNNNNNNNNNLTLHQRLGHARQIHQLLTQLNIPCIEPAYTALIRLAVRARDYNLAEGYLNDAEGTQQCKVKLRMYSSLLRGYCGDYYFSEEKLSDDDDDDDDDIITNGGGGRSSSSSSNRAVLLPTREGLIKALKVWKRMYDNSGGISPGHPRYHESNTNTSNKQQQDDGNSTPSSSSTTAQQHQPLFGEGVSPKISLSEYEYSSLLKCATALRDVKVAERVLSDITESVMVPGLSTVEVMLDWFRSDHHRGGGAIAAVAPTDDSDEMSTATSTSALDCVTMPPREGEGLSVGPVTNDTGRGWNIYRDCTIDSSTGELHLNNNPAVLQNNGTTSDCTSKQIQYRLKPVELTHRAWKAMREMNSSIVLKGTVEGNISTFQGGGKGKKRPRGSDVVSKLHDGNGNGKQGSFAHNNRNMNNHKKKDTNWRINHWKGFETFIENHAPYNIVIDGANVGYYNQTYRLGSNAPRHVDYRQIHGLIRHLLEPPSSHDEQRHHHNIILFMHERHFSQKLLPQWAYPIIQLWDGNEAPYDRLTVYRTPQGLNDDWYWMHAALINGGNESKPSVLAVTNDEMRDHHFQMTAQGYFLRWKERHQVHFDFGEWNRELKRNDVLLKYPSIYSRRIQRVDGESSNSAVGVVTGADAIVIPLPKKGDENRFVDGVHVAEDGIPEEETYVVVQRVVTA